MKWKPLYFIRTRIGLSVRDTQLIDKSNLFFVGGFFFFISSSSVNASFPDTSHVREVHVMKAYALNAAASRYLLCKSKAAYSCFLLQSLLFCLGMPKICLWLCSQVFLLVIKKRASFWRSKFHIQFWLVFVLELDLAAPVWHLVVFQGHGFSCSLSGFGLTDTSDSRVLIRTINPVESVTD